MEISLVANEGSLTFLCLSNMNKWDAFETLITLVSPFSIRTKAQPDILVHLKYNIYENDQKKLPIRCHARDTDTYG